MIIKTNYFELLNQSGVIYKLSEMIELPEDVDSDDGYSYLCGLEKSYLKGDFESAETISDYLEFFIEYSNRTNTTVFTQLDLWLLQNHLCEIKINLYMNQEQFL